VARENIVAGEAKGPEKKMGGILASTVSSFPTLQLSDRLSGTSRSRKTYPERTLSAF
jgi:hypothetical protein